MFKVLTLFLIINSAFGSEVLELTDLDFDSQISQYLHVLVQFYIPSCPHSQNLAPEYELAAEKLKNSDKSCAFAKVNCDEELETCRKYQIDEYPKIKVFNGGAFEYDYRSLRNTEYLVKFMIQINVTAWHEIKKVEELPILTSGTIGNLLFYTKKENSPQLFTYKSLAVRMNSEPNFFYTFNEEIAKSIGITEGVHIIYPVLLATKFDDPFLKYKGADTVDDMKKWIEDNILGVAGIRDQKSAKYFNKRPLVIVYCTADYEKDPKGSNYWRKRILSVTWKYLKDSTKNLYMGFSNAKYHDLEIAKFGVMNVTDTKVYVVALDKEERKFRMEEEFSLDNIMAFIEDFQAGKLTPYVKSEDIPVGYTGPVKVVVANNFDKIVNDPTKDVMIEFYKPWCPHCKDLAPKYEEVARKLYNEPGIVIAKMDVLANDVPRTYSADRSPMIYFVPKNKKSSPQLFGPKREVSDFIKFIAKEATDPLQGFDREGNVIKREF